MADSNKTTVYRFRRIVCGLEISPRHMWGTVEAIATLDECTPIAGTERSVHRKLLEEGFFFEQVATAYVTIEQEHRPEP